MPAQILAINPHYKNITIKTQTISASSSPLTPLVVGTDKVQGRADNIVLQAYAANTGKIYINNGVAVAGSGIELAPGQTLALPGNGSDWQIIGTAADKMAIIYQASPN